MEGALAAFLDHFRKYPSSVQMAEVAVPVWMNFSLQYYIQTILDQVRQSTEAYAKNFEGDITSVWCLSPKMFGRYGRQMRSNVVLLQRDGSRSGERSSSSKAMGGIYLLMLEV